MNIYEVIDVKKDKEVYATLLANICEAFAYDKRIQKELDKLYEEYKYTAYKKVKESKVYNHLIITQGDLEKEIYCNKALGLILLGEEDDVVSKKLLALIKRYYNELYTAVNSKLESDLLKYFAKFVLEDYIPSIRKANEYLGAYLIIKTKSKESFTDGHKKYIDSILKSSNAMTTNTWSYLDTKVSIKESIEKIYSIFKRIEENKGYYHCYEDIYNSRDEEIKKYEAIISLIFDFEKMSISNLLNSVELSDQDIFEIILAYTILYKDKNIERSTNVLINGIIIKSLIKAYKKVKEAYFKNNKETLYLEFETLENEIKELENKYKLSVETSKSIKSKLSKINVETDKKISKIENDYKSQISLLNKQIKKLEQELQNEKKNKRELVELREVIFNIENNDEINKPTYDLQNLIGDKKIMVVGGTFEWRKRLKDKNPEILTLDGFTETFDTRIFNNIDIVFFYVGYMNHGTYYKVVNTLKNKEIPFKYIGRTNIELVENEIADELKNLVEIKE